MSRLETASGFVEQADSLSKVRCPTCGSSHPRRVERKGFLQERILPVFGFYPWLCGACRTSFLIRKRFRRKLKHRERME